MLDCDDPTGLPAVLKRFFESQDTTLSISGRVAKEAFAMWRAWADDGVDKNIRIVLDEALADNGGFWELAAFLGDFEMGQDSAKDSTTFTAEISANGRRTWTDAPA